MIVFYTIGALAYSSVALGAFLELLDLGEKFKLSRGVNICFGLTLALLWPLIPCGQFGVNIVRYARKGQWR